MSIGNRIKEFREKKGLSQPQLAAACGWKKIGTRISNYESNIREPSLSDIKVISDALGEDPANLVQDELCLKESKIPLKNWGNINGEPINKVISPIPVSNKAYALKIQNDHMCSANFGRITFIPGAIIIVEPVPNDHNSLDYIDKYVIIKLHDDGDILLRQLQNLGKQKRYMPIKDIADNFSLEEAEIIGVVVASMNLDL